MEIREDTSNLDPDRIGAAVTSRTKAIVAVHLYGQPADMDAIREIGARHGLRVIEDAAQAQGAKYKGLQAGALSDAAGFSFYPTKNLGALGDGGAVVSNDRQLTEAVRRLRNYGALGKFDHEIVGFNSRLDPLQAAFLRVRLRHLEHGNQRRQAVAEKYIEKLSAVPRCAVPLVPAWADPACHLFVIRHPQRDRLRRYLESHGIETLIHYPQPPRLSRAFADLGFKPGDFPITERLAGTVLSLPMHPRLDPESVEQVVRAFWWILSSARRRMSSFAVQQSSAQVVSTLLFRAFTTWTCSSASHGSPRRTSPRSLPIWSGIAGTRRRSLATCAPFDRSGSRCSRNCSGWLLRMWLRLHTKLAPT